jgi:protein-tyrosine phosphatase
MKCVPKKLLLSGSMLLLAIAGSNRATCAVTDATVERFDETYVVVTWAGAAPVDVYLTHQPDAAIGKATLLVAGNHDGRYMATLSGAERPFFLLHDKADNSTVLVGEHLIPLQQGSNMRDLGGYPAADGKHIRWGLIYRSGATPMLTQPDIASVHALNVHTMIDLRSTDERQVAPSRLIGPDMHYIAVDYAFKQLPETYFEILTFLAPQYRAIFHELLSEKGPIVYNCTAGQDRTGIATALILSALGVPRATILQDYHLTTTSRHPQYEYPPIDPAKFPNNPIVAYSEEVRKSTPGPLYTPAGRSYLAEMFDQLDAHWGTVDNYLDKTLGIGPKDLAQLRSHYLQ